MLQVKRQVLTNHIALFKSRLVNFSLYFLYDILILHPVLLPLHKEKTITYNSTSKLGVGREVRAKKFSGIFVTANCQWFHFVRPWTLRNWKWSILQIQWLAISWLQSWLTTVWLTPSTHWQWAKYFSKLQLLDKSGFGARAQQYKELFFLKMGNSRPLFLYFHLFNTQLTVNKCSIYK